MLHINKNTIKFVSILFISMVLNGCKKDFLDINPKGKLIAQKTSDYDLLLNDQALTLVTPASHILMSDEVAGSSPAFSSLGAGIGTLADQKAFKWEDDIYVQGDNASEISLLVKGIYTNNKIINEVMTSEGGTDAQKKAILAEALAGRAWANFVLINLYGKPYNTNSSLTDLGIPLLKTADVTQTKFTRATVQEAYDLIIADLNQAIPDLSATVVSRVRMSKAAAKALLAKVYVFMGKFDQALPLLNGSISDLTGAEVPVGLYNFSTELAAGGAFYPSNPIVGPPRNDPNKDKEIVFLRYTPNYYSYVFSGAVISPEASALFKASDLRKQFLTPYSFGMASVYPLGMLRTYGKGYSSMGITVPDMYLLRAECRSRLGDLPGAATDMQAFRLNRMPAADAAVPAGVSGDQVTLTKFILEERIREFAVNGDRWFDMRRLSVDPVYKSTVGTTHRIYDNSGAVTATYTLRPERLTFRFPLYIMNANPDMPQNP
ncbi:RagB/SusD family nutrient uptake outer membrane protein [Pedobacter punctiformis]|uniref:RagB/SusD family nutrient uptake outer membrane protein n=1 Tax=Pedobacter punctiformis TaxID=3004097 RepID=A0ABT4LAI3_9SPHI|nr:RagB/SusD family nutrient uptake outer membrane protein [Pedobacter sp. HCMS5-2]MCZ4244173.1 RagB/SusD family nutrient uptake outer membrane protein [Pedobacter sp. HCMS5-2]